MTRDKYGAEREPEPMPIDEIEWLDTLKGIDAIRHPEFNVPGPFRCSACYGTGERMESNGSGRVFRCEACDGRGSR